MRTVVSQLLLVLLAVSAGGLGRELSLQSRGMSVQSSEGPGRRLALVIGNQDYPKGALKNPIRDALAIKQTLEGLGFEVDYKSNATLRELGQSVDSFTAKLRSKDAALFYFAGHGIQVEGMNYILPVDFSADKEADVEYAAYAMDRVRRKMEEGRTGLNILILDACRDNPYRFGRSSRGGLAPMSEGIGTVIAFAAADGQVASDNQGGQNGLFTQYLLQELQKPGLGIRDLFYAVQKDVYEASGRKQFPYVYSGVVYDFYFRPPASQGTVSYERPSSVPPANTGRVETPTTTATRPTFETESYRVTVETLSRRGNALVLTLVFENLEEKNISLSLDGGRTYLLDENGERWNLDTQPNLRGVYDSGGIFWYGGYGPATLLPGTKLKIKIVFSAQGQTNGSEFTFASVELQPRYDRQVLIRGLK